MLKKIMVASTILLLSSSVSFANGIPYVGGGVGIDTNTSSSGSFRGIDGSLFAGYGASFGQSTYLAGEAFGTLGTITVDNYRNGINLHTTYAYGLSVIPGLMLSDHTMAFARAGLIWSYFTTKSSSVMGGQVGLGLQTGLTQNWELRGEYDYVDYKKISGVSSQSDQFNLSVVYKFQ